MASGYIKVVIGNNFLVQNPTKTPGSFPSNHGARCLDIGKPELISSQQFQVGNSNQPIAICSETIMGLIRFLRRGPRGASHEKFHAAPSKKQARFLEGPLSLRTQGKSNLLRSPFASKKVPSGTFLWLTPFCSPPIFDF